MACATAIAFAGAFAASCNGIVDPSKNHQDMRTGTIAIQGQASQSFSTSNTGEFSVRIDSLAPQTGVFVGVIQSTAASDGSCNGSLPILQQNGFATNNSIALTGQIFPGSYCIFLYDVGTFTTTETYTITLSYP